jgi:hypothetical protein
MNLSANLTICPAAVVSTSHDYQLLLWSHEQDCVVIREVHDTRTTYWWGEKHESQLGVCMGLPSLNDWIMLKMITFSSESGLYTSFLCWYCYLCTSPFCSYVVWQDDRCSGFSHVTISYQDLMTGVICSLSKFNWGRHNKSHVRLVAIPVITLLLGIPDIKCQRIVT